MRRRAPRAPFGLLSHALSEVAVGMASSFDWLVFFALGTMPGIF